MVFAADFRFKTIHFRREEFDRASAGSTDHVMVAAAIVLMLVASDAIVKCNFACQSTLSQQLQGTIDCREANTRISLAYELVELLGGEMFVGLEEGEQDRVALLRPLEADALQVLMKALLRLAQ